MRHLRPSQMMNDIFSACSFTRKSIIRHAAHESSGTLRVLRVLQVTGQCPLSVGASSRNCAMTLEMQRSFADYPAVLILRLRRRSFTVLCRAVDLCFCRSWFVAGHEAESVTTMFRESFNIPLSPIDASVQFLAALRGISDPETKRKTIGRLFIDVFREEAKKSVVPRIWRREPCIRM